MPKKLLRRKKLDALTLVAQGHTQAHVVRLTYVSVSTIGRAKKKQKLYGDIEGGARKRGRRAKFTPGIIDVIFLFSCLQSYHCTRLF
jgi:hypothetical protein